MNFVLLNRREIYCCLTRLNQKTMIDQKINQEMLLGKVTILAVRRFVFQTVSVLNIQRFQFHSQNLVFFLIQDSVTLTGISLSEISTNWERECYGIALCLVNVDINILEKNVSGDPSVYILISL